MTRNELIAAGDKLVQQIEEANLERTFSPVLAQAVYKYEFLVHFEGFPAPPKEQPKNGSEAHSRLMDAMGYVLKGEVEKEEISPSDYLLVNIYAAREVV